MLQQLALYVFLTNVAVVLPPKAHSSVERAALIGGVMMRKVPTDKTYAIRGDMLKKIMEEDKAAGFIPFYVRKDKDQHLFSYHRVNTHRQTHTAIVQH